MGAPQIPLRERIERNYITEPNTGCWLWTSCLDTDGYGYLHNRTYPGAKNMKAHRVAYEQFIGPIPEGKYVCHTCDVPSCVNPRHLWLGNHEENQKDRIRKNRSSRGIDRHNAKLNPKLVRKIRKAEGSLSRIAMRFHVVPQTVHDVKARKTWKHVP